MNLAVKETYLNKGTINIRVQEAANARQMNCCSFLFVMRMRALAKTRAQDTSAYRRIWTNYLSILT